MNTPIFQIAAILVAGFPSLLAFYLISAFLTRLEALETFAHGLEAQIERLELIESSNRYARNADRLRQLRLPPVARTPGEN